MKLFLLAQIALAQYNPEGGDEVTVSPPADGVSCFHCDAKNMTHCRDIGVMKECPDNALSCMVEIRKREGNLESICMGCKSPEACEDNKAQNFIGKWADRQCKPFLKAKGPSVCRQCCNTPGCETDLGDNTPTTPAGWKEVLMV